MAEEHKKGLDAELVWNDLQNCCRDQSICGQCQEENCIIGYAKEWVMHSHMREAPCSTLCV